MDPNNTSLAAAQDDLRPARMFIGVLQSAFGLDQQAGGYDSQAVNSPYRYQAIGPTGVGIEGAPISTAQGAGQSAAAGMSPLMLVGLAVVAALVLPKLLRG